MTLLNWSVPSAPRVRIFSCINHFMLLFPLYGKLLGLRIQRKGVRFCLVFLAHLFRIWSTYLLKIIFMQVSAIEACSTTTISPVALAPEEWGSLASHWILNRCVKWLSISSVLWSICGWSPVNCQVLSHKILVKETICTFCSVETLVSLRSFHVRDDWRAAQRVNDIVGR